MIQDQVKLPISVAFEVSMQGIRMRFGRSVVTIMGVMLGVAFLMSILTGQIIKKGVSAEEAVRRDVDRMLSFLTADMGPPAGRVLGVIQTGPLEDKEMRLLRKVREGHIRSIRWAAVAPGLEPPPVVRGVAQRAELSDVADDTSAVIVMGGPPPKADWSALMAKARQAVLCFARPDPAVASIKGVSLVPLARALRPDEIERMEKERRRDRFRSIWIVTISLMVTVICISNSLLMSVTERFREIGTMKCLGALSSFIRQLFLIESSIVGLAGAVLGTLFGLVFSTFVYSLTFGFGLVLSSLGLGSLSLYSLFCVVVGLVLSVVAAIYPASFASRMVPGAALRTTI